MTNNDGLWFMGYLAERLWLLNRTPENLPLSFSVVRESQWAYLVLRAAFEGDLGER